MWSRAWEEAVAGLSADPGRLERGRRYDEQGQVAAVTVTPGQALAYVHGSRARPYRARLRLRTFGEAEWDPLLDALAARPERLAALLEKELPAALLTAEGSALPPSAGEPVPECSCPDTARPCKHAAALAYRVGRLIAEDPFVLLLLRGRGEEDLIDDLTRRHAHLAAEEEGRAERLPGMPAAEALSRPLRPLPPPLPRLDRVDPPPPYPAAVGGPDPLALDQVASDAASRALTFLRTGTDPVAGLSLWQDAVRLAASRPGSGLTSSGRTLYARLAVAAGRTPTDLMRAVAAWRRGGAEALEMLEGEPWDPPAGPFDRARPLLLAYGHAPYRPWHNRLTRPGGRHQLRMGRDGIWYGYESEPEAEDWWPRGTPGRDPAAVLDSLLGETATPGPGETDFAAGTDWADGTGRDGTHATD
ncbi:SWIM zinc finger family protein [Streptomyces sp. NPDC007088]|uniref:SWIM zinc finger family protein n=1 Tax=Streptomyces sp. NPDC007088 TaxID=3364773 RepID=UPI0036A5E745